MSRKRWPPPDMQCTCSARCGRGQLERHASDGAGRCADYAVCTCDHFNLPPTPRNVFHWALEGVRSRLWGDD